MARWIALEGEELQDYLDGHMAPLMAQETEHGVQVWSPHWFTTGRLTGARTCSICGLLPLDYDSIEVPCEAKDKEDA